MISYRELQIADAYKIKEVDRSERINLIYEVIDGKLKEIQAAHDCPNWSPQEIDSLVRRFRHELEHGGKAFGAFDQKRLIGFGVLAHELRGKNRDQLQIDLMYVSKEYRRKGIGKHIMNELSKVAKLRGAKFLYISSTETESAYNFYKRSGCEITDEVDEELFKLEPKDIHMIKKL